MKYNNFFIALALCAAMQSNMSFSQSQDMENPIAEEIAQEQELKPQEPVNQSYFQRAKSYAASWIPQSVKDTVNSWSTKKKLAVAGAIIGALAALYNKDQIMDWVNGILEQQKLEIDNKKKEMQSSFMSQMATLMKKQKEVDDKSDVALAIWQNDPRPISEKGEEWKQYKELTKKYKPLMGERRKLESQVIEQGLSPKDVEKIIRELRGEIFLK
jgi:hypothetical protein